MYIFFLKFELGSKLEYGNVLVEVSKSIDYYNIATEVMHLEARRIGNTAENTNLK